jgi:hypothetical protein
MSRYDREPVALSLYGPLLLLIGLTRLVVWLYATSRPRLMYEPIDQPSRRGPAHRDPCLPLAPRHRDRGRSPDRESGIYAGVPLLYFVSLIITKAKTPPGVTEEDFS